MDNKIIIYTDASNIRNSNLCNLSSIINYNNKERIIQKQFKGKINQAELAIVLDTFVVIEKDYSPKDISIDLHTDHKPNSELLNRLLVYSTDKKETEYIKINKILLRKNIRWEELDVIFRLNNKNKLRIVWISRKDNFAANKLAKNFKKLIP